jgi:gliding motility-associated-like protein
MGQIAQLNYFDTLVVPPLLEVDLALGPDTFVRKGTTLRLSSKVTHGVSPFKYQWFTPTNLKKDTLDYLDVKMITADSTIRVEITDKNKCVAFDTLNIFLKENPVVNMGPDKRICWYDSFLVVPTAKNAFWIDPVTSDTMQQGDTLLWQWQYYGADYSTATTSKIARRGVYTVSVMDSLGCIGSDTFNLIVNDTLFPKAGPDQVKCFNDTLVLTAGGLDTIKNGKKGSYAWYRGLPKTPPSFSNQKVVKFKVQTSNSYLLELMVKEDTLKCYGFDTTNIKVNPLPTITLTTPQKYCCDYGNVNLGSTLFGSPAGGTWSCRQNASFVNSNVFLTPNACDPKKAGIFTLIYTYKDPTTSCIKYDSTLFTINPLPALQFDGGTICQNANRVKLKAAAPAPIYIKAPINLNSMTSVQFKLLRSVPKTGGGFCTVNDLISDDDPSLNYDFWLNVSKSIIDLGTSNKDSIQLEISIIDGQGCSNKDTAWFYIVKVPVITFSGFPDLCIDKGAVNLSSISNTKPLTGKWSVIDSTGITKSKTILQPGINANGDTLDTKKISLQNGPGIYKMRYTDLASGCYVKKDTILRINPLPNVKISISPTGDNGKFCEIDPDVTLNANPSGGTWSSTVAGVISGGKFQPSAVSAAERDKWITLTYRYTDPSTKCDTSKSLQVFVQSKPVINILNNDIDTCRSNTMDITLKATYAFTSKISWVHSFDPTRGGFDNNGTQLSNNNPTVYNIKPRGDSITNVVITAFTEAMGVCPFAQDNLFLKIHPRPNATVTIDDADGCAPHTVNFTTTINNGVDATKSTFNWKFGDQSNGTGAVVSHIYPNTGSYLPSLQVISEFGCDTTLGPFNIDVYPIPVAAFTPNPNNATTAALPRFRFTNESKVVNVAGSRIQSNSWDFGDLNSNTDTSTLLNPEYYYSSDTMSYWVTLIVETNHGCRDTVSKKVIVGPDILVYIPNAFSPDGAGPLMNDKFAIQASGFTTYQVMLFNRWGERLYTSNKLDEPWDGMYNGQPCQMDAYVYEVEVTSFIGKLYRYSGTVLLIK